MKLKLLCLLILAQSFSACYSWRSITYKDHTSFNTVSVKADDKPSPIPRQILPGTSIMRIQVPYKDSIADMDFKSFLEHTNTRAFIIMKNGYIVYENYAEGTKAESMVNTHGISKSVISSLIGLAISEGIITDISDLVITYIPELKDYPGMDKLSLKDLMNMESGVNFNESGGLFGEYTKLYFGRNTNQHTLKAFSNGVESGADFEYKYINYQLLTMVLERAVSPMSLPEFMEEKLWQPAGMAHNAKWLAGKKDGTPIKGLCCISMAIEDMVRFGALFANDGAMMATEIIPAEWVERSFNSYSGEAVFFDENAGGGPEGFQLGWWMASSIYGDYFTHGMKGHYIYTVPESGLLMIRIGDSRDEQVNWIRTMQGMAQGLFK